MTINGLTTINIYHEWELTLPLVVSCYNYETKKNIVINNTVLFASNNKTTIRGDFSELEGQYMLSIADQDNIVFKMLASTPLKKIIDER